MVLGSIATPGPNERIGNAFLRGTGCVTRVGSGVGGRGGGLFRPVMLRVRVAGNGTGYVDARMRERGSFVTRGRQPVERRCWQSPLVQSGRVLSAISKIPCVGTHPQAGGY
jgi:hypothetical protein